MFFIGDSNCRGVYYFHSTQLTGWLVCDVDNGTCKLLNKLALLRIDNRYDEVLEPMERRHSILGQQDDRYLVDGERTLLPLLRDHGNAIEVLMVYYPEGDWKPYGKLEVEAGKIMRKARKRLKKSDPNS